MGSGNLLKNFYGDGRLIDLKVGPGQDVSLVIDLQSPGTTEIRTIWCGRVDDLSAAQALSGLLRIADGTIDEPISTLSVTRDPQWPGEKQLHLALYDRRQTGTAPELTFRFRDLSER